MSTIRRDVREWRIVVRRYLVSSLVSRRLSSVRVVVTPSSVRECVAIFALLVLMKRSNVQT